MGGRVELQKEAYDISQTKAEYKIYNIRVHLNLEHKVFFCGAKVKGMVYFEVPPADQVQSILLQIVGKEEVVLSKWVSKGSVIGKKHLERNPHAHVTKGKVLIDEKDINYFINHQYCLYGNEGSKASSKQQLRSGQYRFPFMFELPRYIPGSFAYEWITDNLALNYGIVKYKCRAILSSREGIYKSSQKFLVQQPLCNQPGSCYARFNNIISNFFCCSKRNFSFSMRTTKPSYRLGEEIEVLLIKEEGATRRRFGKIEAEIVRVVKIKTLGGKERNYEDTVKKFEG